MSSSDLLPSPRDGTKTLPKRGPLDLITFLRTRGGLIDQGGDLAHMGIDNTPRNMDFAAGENRFGKLVDPENGMLLDDAADLAWREGYFPDHTERPTVREFLEAVGNTHIADVTENIDGVGCYQHPALPLFCSERGCSSAHYATA